MRALRHMYAANAKADHARRKPAQQRELQQNPEKQRQAERLAALKRGAAILF
jgi:hypothetical protein